MTRTIALGIFGVAIVLLTACSEDPENQLRSDGLAFEPLIRITAPATGSQFAPGDTIEFAATVGDLEDKPAALGVRWSSNKDGLLNQAAADSAGKSTFRTHQLSYNVHQVKLVVTDSDGNATRDSVLLYCNLPAPCTLLPIERAGNAARLTWSASPIPDFVSYKIYRSSTSGRGTQGTLVATVTAQQDTTYLDAGIPFGVKTYYQVFVFNSSALSAGSNEATIEITNIAIRFAFATTDALIHPSEPLIFLTSKDAKALYRVNYETGTCDTMTFDYMTESLDIRDTGSAVEVYVALLTQNHSHYWWEEDQEGYIAIVDATTFGLIETMHISLDPYDIVAGRDGYLYVPSGSGQWTWIRSYHRVTHALGGTGNIRQMCEAKLHPTDNRIYTMDTEVSPRDMEAFLVNNGAFTSSYDSPYHGDYGFGHPFRICPTGEYLITSSGTIYACSAVRAQDLIYRGNLGEGFRDVAFDVAGMRIFTCTSAAQIKTYDYQTFAAEGGLNMEGVGRFLFLKPDTLIAVVEPRISGASYVTGIEVIAIQ